MLAVHSAKPAGAQFVALMQARRLNQHFDLTIPVPKGSLSSDFEEVGQVIRRPIRLPIWGAPAKRWAIELIRSVPDTLRLAAVIRRHRLRAVVTNSTVLVSPVLAARLAGVPVLVHAQEAPKSAAARRLFRFHARMADVVIAPSAWIEEAFRDSPRARIVRIPNGIPIPPEPERPGGDFEHPLRLCLVGTIDRHKAQHVAVEALALLRDRGVDAVLELVGPEQDATYARETHDAVDVNGLCTRVTFSGPTNGIDAVLSRTDVMLVPAGEVTPMVLFHALAAKIPVVAANMGSIGEIVLHEETGLLTPPRDSAAMADAVEQLAEAPALAQHVAVRGRAHVERCFDQERLVERLRVEIAREISRTSKAVTPCVRKSPHDSTFLRWMRAPIRHPSPLDGSIGMLGAEIRNRGRRWIDRVAPRAGVAALYHTSVGLKYANPLFTGYMFDAYASGEFKTVDPSELRLGFDALRDDHTLLGTPLEASPHVSLMRALQHTGEPATEYLDRVRFGTLDWRPPQRITPAMLEGTRAAFAACSDEIDQGNTLTVRVNWVEGRPYIADGKHRAALAYVRGQMVLCESMLPFFQDSYLQWMLSMMARRPQVYGAHLRFSKSGLANGNKGGIN